MIKLLMVALLLLPPAAWACDLPRNVRASTPAHCAAIQDAWRETLKRVWFTSHVNEVFYGVVRPLPTESIADMGEIRFVAHAGEYFYSPEYRDYVYGIFLPGRREIHYADGTLAVIKHEIAHWYLWHFRRVYGDSAWLWVGHQNELDPFWNVLKAIEAMMYQ